MGALADLPQEAHPTGGFPTSGSTMNRSPSSGSPMVSVGQVSHVGGLQLEVAIIGGAYHEH
jgi:hypothetical protein